MPGGCPARPGAMRDVGMACRGDVPGTTLGRGRVGFVSRLRRFCDACHGSQCGGGEAIKVIMITRFCHTHEVIILVEGKPAPEAGAGVVVAGDR